jgi:hypothetical protein
VRVGCRGASRVSLAVKPTFAFGGWIGFPDLGKEGSGVTIVIGQPPKLIDNDLEVRGRRYEDEDTTLHLEAPILFLPLIIST